mmetsp:Transcript_70545/g.223515  ORF Transcript_70545/g.223515 Transcript_70545/m.223515 type:complete len:286 (-) Transcript_70545:300-1157(-)
MGRGARAAVGSCLPGALHAASAESSQGYKLRALRGRRGRGRRGASWGSAASKGGGRRNPLGGRQRGPAGVQGRGDRAQHPQGGGGVGVGHPPPPRRHRPLHHGGPAGEIRRRRQSRGCARGAAGRGKGAVRAAHGHPRQQHARDGSGDGQGAAPLQGEPRRRRQEAFRRAGRHHRPEGARGATARRGRGGRVHGRAAGRSPGGGKGDGCHRGQRLRGRKEGHPLARCRDRQSHPEADPSRGRGEHGSCRHLAIPRGPGGGCGGSQGDRGARAAGGRACLHRPPDS